MSTSSAGDFVVVASEPLALCGAGCAAAGALCDTGAAPDARRLAKALAAEDVWAPSEVEFLLKNPEDEARLDLYLAMTACKGAVLSALVDTPKTAKQITFEPDPPPPAKSIRDIISPPSLPFRYRPRGDRTGSRRPPASPRGRAGDGRSGPRRCRRD